MKTLIYAGALAFITISLSACNDNRRAKNYNERTQVDDQGLAFLQNATQDGITEIKAAQIAEKNSTNPRVVNFAKMMITDHTVIGNKLKEIAEDKFATLRSDTLTKTHQMMVDSLAKLNGVAFDKMYMQMMVADHSKAIELFRSTADNKNTAIKGFAEKTLPKLQTHLDSAKAIYSSLK